MFRFYYIPILAGFRWKPDWKSKLEFSEGIEIKILANTFGAIPFESLKISLAKLHSQLRVWIETDLSLSKKNQKDECFSLRVIWNLSWSLNILLFRILPWGIPNYKWTIVDVLSVKISLAQWNLVIKNPEGIKGFSLI